MTKYQTFFAGLLAISLVTFLGGCQNTKESLGIGTRDVPDEFAVIKQEPLTLPPDYSLRPPQPGAPRPQTREADATAKELVTGQSRPALTTNPNITQGEKAFLQNAGAEKASPDIREIIDATTRQRSRDEVPVAKKIFGLGNKKPPATIVDPAKERERLKTNLESDKPITQGETPSIED